MKKGVSIYVILGLIILANVFVKVFFFSSNYPFVGSAIDTASIVFVVADRGNIITILSPLNITYNFSIGGGPYTLDLNVSADFNATSWWFTLLDVRHGDYEYYENPFSPNTTFDAARWSNVLTVYANSSLGNIVSKNVTFFVYVPNSAPFLGNLDSLIYVCENTALNYNFNASDVDEDMLTLDIFPKNPFFLDPTSSEGISVLYSTIISVLLTKTYAGGVNNGFLNYDETISVTDGEYVDIANTNITVLEVNNAPEIEEIGVQTVWLVGDNNTFYKQVVVDDVEEGDESSGNLNFNLTFFGGEDLFIINSSGAMEFTPNSSQIGVYNLSVCVTDNGIQNPHVNISLCGQDGGNITSCNNFSLTVTNENRAPTIVSYYPLNLTLNVSSTDSLYFNISKYDPDGTIPDARWYVDDSLVQFNSGNLTDEFFYSFGCGVSGPHTVKAEITDGALNDSVVWMLNVAEVICVILPERGGGGGGGFSCEEIWLCDEWSVCQNTEKSLSAGMLVGEDYRNIFQDCSNEAFDDRTCGVQFKMCSDSNSCNTTYLKPDEFRSCYYTENPSCFDGLKNCHDGGCELLVDCGGPCDACATCSDGIQNQREEGVDCGGPCPWKCSVKEPFESKIALWQILIFSIILVLIIILIIKILRILKMKKDFGSLSSDI